MHTFVISMDTPNGRARWPAVQRECETAGLECERVKGVNGAQLSAETVASVTSPLCKVMCTPGMVGCAMSHMRCWRTVVERGLPMALVLEDDATLAPRFSSRVREVVEKAPPGWHVIVLGCSMCQPWIQRVLGGGKTLFDNGVVRELRFFGGTHCYLVSTAGARHLVRHMSKIQFHVDMQMSRTPGLRLYGVHEDLAFQGAATSTSALTSVDFPGTLNALLSRFQVKGVGADYAMNVPWARLGPYDAHLVVTPMSVVFFALGLGGVPWRWVLGVSAVDMLLFPPQTVTSPLTLVGAYGLGYGLRLAVK